MATGAFRATLTDHTEPVYAVAFSPDGKTLATTSGDATVRVWDVATGAIRATLTGGAGPVAFSPDGKTLATGSYDNTARLWDVATGVTRATLFGHTSNVLSVAFSPDGKTLATGSYDNTARLWDIALPDPAHAVTEICRAVGRDLTPQERALYLPGEPTTPACPPR